VFKLELRGVNAVNKDVNRRGIILGMAVGLLGLGRLAWGAPGPVAAYPEPTREGIQFFERRIRPVLIERCYSCHSAQTAQPGGALRLDSRDALRQGGQDGPVVVPGDPGRSLLVEILRRPHPDNRMPPQSALSRSAMLDFESWVRMGCPDPRGEKQKAESGKLKVEGRTEGRHWAFEPVKDLPFPAVRDAAWSRSPIDRFILARLEQRGVPPAPAADRETLLRRATFDLTGLPPTVEEIDTFLADPSPKAFEKVVDRLLGSPRFGERWGQHWLKVVRYADAAGGEWDAVRENAWRYRDYVIAAFNADKPYDEFIREQLAGDLLPSNDEAVQRERLVATGFLEVGARLGVEPKRNRLLLEIADDQVELTTRVFLGLTVACARCHDHKSDPIPMREYYSMAGIFLSTASLADGAEPGRRPTPRWLERSLATQDELRAISEFESRFEELKEQLQEARQMKIAFPGEIDSARLAGVVVDNLAAEIHGAWKESNYSTNFVDRNYLHDADSEKGRKSARFVPDLPRDGLYDVLISYTPRANRATNVPVTVHSQDGAKTVYLNQTLTPTIDKVFASVGQFRFAAGNRGAVVISNQGTKGFVVVDAVRFVPVEPGGSAALAAAQHHDPETALLNYHDLERQVLEFRSQRPLMPQAMAVQEGKIQEGRIRLDGNPDRQGDEVPRGFLSALGTPDSTLYAVTDETSGRLELAHWLVDPDNALTARVAVNRIWLHLFGQGLVTTPDDFGTLGEPPSHPGLLDYLARRFVEQGWSVKKLIRSILLSNTYQMRSLPSPPLKDDPDNRLLACRSPRSLELETVRDTVLFLSGQLDLNGGGTWMPTNRGAATPIQLARRAQLNSVQRSVYVPVIRDVKSEVLNALDIAGASGSGPEPRPTTSSSSAPRRRIRFVEEQSLAWAEFLLRASATNDAQRISLAYRQAHGRLPTVEETAQATRLLRAPPPADSSSPMPVRGAWERFCRALLTSQAFRTLD
jgi:hypothetical protein